MAIFGAEVQQKFDEIEATAIKDRAEVDQLKARIELLEKKPPAATADDELKAKCQAIEVAMQALKEEQQSTGRASPSPSQSLAYECRTVARIGNCGWDVPSEDLVARAAGIPDNQYHSLHSSRPKHLKGSSCDLVFRNAEQLQTGKAAMQAMAHVFDGCSNPAWLDARNIAKIMHRMHDVLQDIENIKPERVKLTKFMNGEQIKRNGTLIGHTAHSRWVWTSSAFNLYSLKETPSP